MKIADQNKVLEILSNIIPAEGQIEWKDIMEAVSKEVTVKNWLKVRGVLQYLINTKCVCRTPSVHIEAYTKV